MPLGFFIFGGFFIFFSSFGSFLFSWFLFFSSSFGVSLDLSHGVREFSRSVAFDCSVIVVVAVCFAFSLCFHQEVSPKRLATPDPTHTQHTHEFLHQLDCRFGSAFFCCCCYYFLVAFDSASGPNCSIQFVWLKMKREIESKNSAKMKWFRFSDTACGSVCVCGVGVLRRNIQFFFFISIKTTITFFTCVKCVRTREIRKEKCPADERNEQCRQTAV